MACTPNLPVKLDDPCFIASYTNLTPDPLVETLEYIYSRYLSKQRIRAQVGE